MSGQVPSVQHVKTKNEGNQIDNQAEQKLEGRIRKRTFLQFDDELDYDVWIMRELCYGRPK